MRRPAVTHRLYAPPPVAPRARRATRQVDYHVVGCDCPVCEPYAPSVVPALSGRAAAALAAAGFVTATAIALAIDPIGTRAVLADLFHWWFVAWAR